MQEGAKSFWEWWKEKTSSSFYLTFLIAFSAWNWKAIFVLLSDDPTRGYVEKLNYIYTILYPNDFLLTHLHSIVLPLVSTIVVIVLLPLVNTLVHRHENSQHYKRLQRDAQNKIDTIELTNKLEKLEREKLYLDDKRKEDLQKRYDTEYWSIDPKPLAEQMLIIRNIVDSGKKIDDSTLNSDVVSAINFAKTRDIINVRQSNLTVEWTDKGNYFRKKLQDNLGGYFPW